jgi:hypothetical protein
LFGHPAQPDVNSDSNSVSVNGNGNRLDMNASGQKVNVTGDGIHAAWDDNRKSWYATRGDGSKVDTWQHPDGTWYIGQRPGQRAENSVLT